jgi:hypothetical protein
MLRDPRFVVALAAASACCFLALQLLSSSLGSSAPRPDELMGSYGYESGPWDYDSSGARTRLMESDKFSQMQNQRIANGEISAAKGRVQALALSGPWEVDGTSDRLSRAEKQAYYKNQYQSFTRGESPFTGHYIRRPRLQALSESDYEHDDMDPEERHDERLKAYTQAFNNYENGEARTMFGARKPRMQALSESDYEHDDMDPEERHDERLKAYTQAFNNYENGESRTMFGARRARNMARMQKLSGLSTNANYEYDEPDANVRHNELKGAYADKLEKWYNGERPTVFKGPRKQALYQQFVAVPVEAPPI